MRTATKAKHVVVKGAGALKAAKRSRGKAFKGKEVSFEEFLNLREILQREGELTFRVASGSMHPVLKVGAVITVGPLKKIKNLSRFDIVVFWSKDILICHYFWHLNQVLFPGAEATLSTRALYHKLAEDLPVPLDHVLGVVKSHQIPRWRRLKVLLSVWKRR